MEQQQQSGVPASTARRQQRQRWRWRCPWGRVCVSILGMLMVLIMLFGWIATTLRLSTTAHSYSNNIDDNISRKENLSLTSRRQQIINGEIPPITSNNNLKKEHKVTKSQKNGEGREQHESKLSMNDPKNNIYNDSNIPIQQHQQHQQQIEKIKSKSTSTTTTATTATNITHHKLRFDWTNLTVQSSLAKDMVQHQNNCSLPLGKYKSRNRFGLGSDLHVWVQGLCNAFEADVRTRTALPWIYYDEEACRQSNADTNSAMLCYFPASELNCPGDKKSNKEPQQEQQREISIGYSASGGCKGLLAKYNGTYGISDIRAAGIEYLFRQVSPVLLTEAERQLNLVFPEGTPDGLITVHMRWGDKKKEMKLRKVGEYIRAVENILQKRRKRKKAVSAAAAAAAGKNENEEEEAHIFLATEDPEALRQFTETMPKNWKVHVDHFYTEMLPYRIDEYNGNPKMTRNLKGRPGLIALASLLVAVESDYYVLTTASNWSRLMNELRKNVVDPRCNNCTIMIDLKAGEW